MEDRLGKFVKEMKKMEAIELLGLAHLFGVPLAEQDKARDMQNVIADVLNKFQELSSTKQKEIIKICKQTNRGGKNGNRTESADSKEEIVPAENV